MQIPQFIKIEKPPKILKKMIQNERDFIDFLQNEQYYLSLSVGLREVERFEKIANECSLFLR